MCIRDREPGLATRPLAGLAVAVKDIIDTRDLPTSYGSPIYFGHRPVIDAPVVRQVKRAGGLIPGKTVTTEFAFLAPHPRATPATSPILPAAPPRDRRRRWRRAWYHWRSAPRPEAR